MDYSKPIRLSLFKKIQPVDLFTERFTFGHRLALGTALQQKSPYDIMQQIMSVLHGITIQPRHVRRLYNYFQDILEKLEKWCEREKLLHYEPSAEEKQAGIKQLGEILKEFGQVDSLAVRMHISHDDVLKLPYSTVFMILRKDLEQSKFERRLHKVYERKWKV